MFRGSLGAPCGAAVAAALTIGAYAASADQAAFTVGILRRDAIVIPFARFDGHRWRDVWQRPAIEVEVPINLESVPKRWWAGGDPAADWQVWTLEGASQTVHVVQPDIVPVFCQRAIGLRTDYVSPATRPPLGESPYPKDGLAIAPPHRVEPIETLAPDASELTPSAPIIAAEMNRIERTIGDHPIGRSRRESVAPHVDAAYAFGAHPRIYYVESSREYRDAKANECRAVAVGHLWLAVADRPRPIWTTVFLVPCDRREERYMYPLGALHAADRLFWLAQYSNWDGEYYEVYEVTPDAVHVVMGAPGGVC